MYVTFPKGSKAPHQNVDTQQEIGRDRFIPKATEGKDGGVGHGSGPLETFPPTRKHTTFSTASHHVSSHKPWAKGGGNKQVSFTAPKSRTKFATETHVGKDKFCPKTKSDYGVGGI